jgi:hypothetical protein
MGIGEKILSVIVINKLMPDCLAKNERHNHGQQDADADGRAFWWFTGGHVDGLETKQALENYQRLLRIK